MVPIARPVNALGVHTYYLGSSTVGSCSGRCEMLTTAAVPGIAVDNLATSTASIDSSGHVTISFTVGTGTNRLLIVGGTVDNKAITGVTYGGTALTQAVADTQFPITSIWYLVNPPSGTASVVVTSTASTPAVIGVISFTGVDQTTPIPTTATNDNANAHTSPATGSITNANANAWVMDVVGSGVTGGYTNGASTTTQWNIFGTPGSGASSRSGPLSPNTVTNFSWTLTPDAWDDVAVEIKPFAGTSQVISTTTGNFMVEPDVSASATGTPTTSTPSGYAWETPSAIGAQIVSGIWTFDLTVGSSASTGTASVWITVWNCQTASEGTCAFLFKNWDNTTNVISTGATQRNYVTGTVGPFNSVQFLVVEYWLHVTVAGASGETVSETTVSSASDVSTPGFQYSYSLTENPTISDSTGKLFQGLRTLAESPTVSDALSRTFGHIFTIADTSLFSDSFSRAMKSTRDVLDIFPFATSLSTFANLARGVTDSFPFIESVPISKTLINAFEVLVTDSYAYSDTAAHAARNSVGTIVAIIDRFVFGDQIGSGGSSNPPGFFTDLANRVVAGFNGLTGSSTAISPAVLAFAMIGALAAVIAIFVGRRKGRGGCNVITMATPPCKKYGGRHQCRSHSGHVEAHKCKCGASW